MIKCFECNKKIKLIDTIICSCRCGNVYCVKHRLDHKCLFDYHETYQKPEKIESHKIDKI
jgi:hypothetical protein